MAERQKLPDSVLFISQVSLWDSLTHWVWDIGQRTWVWLQGFGLAAGKMELSDEMGKGVSGKIPTLVFVMLFRSRCWTDSRAAASEGQGRGKSFR